MGKFWEKCDLERTLVSLPKSNKSKGFFFLLKFWSVSQSMLWAKPMLQNDGWEPSGNPRVKERSRGFFAAGLFRAFACQQIDLLHVAPLERSLTARQEALVKLLFLEAVKGGQALRTAASVTLHLQSPESAQDSFCWTRSPCTGSPPQRLFKVLGDLLCARKENNILTTTPPTSIPTLASLGSESREEMEAQRG